MSWVSAFVAAILWIVGIVQLDGLWLALWVVLGFPLSWGGVSLAIVMLYVLVELWSEAS